MSLLLRRRGFTLIELMAASAIATLLIAATLGMTVNLSRTTAAMERMNDSSVLGDSLGTLLETDLVHAQRLRKTAAGFELDSMLLLDAASIEPSHAPSSVSYEIAELGGRRWLLRRQSAKDARCVSLICPDVQAVDISARDGKPLDARQPWTTMQDGATVTVEMTSGQRVVRTCRLK